VCYNHPFKGITWDKGRWHAKVYIDRAPISTPRAFNSKGEAAAIYDSYARAHGLKENEEIWRVWMPSPCLKRFCTMTPPARLAINKSWDRFCVKVVLACENLVPLGAENCSHRFILKPREQ
jgi:hypothetical protein